MKKTEEKGFKCSHCEKLVTVGGQIGTVHRNHCPYCLWSKHVDQEKPGDRISNCQSEMEPIGLTFKQEGWDKRGKARQGELMVIHQCLGCGRIVVNRIAADDQPDVISLLFKKSINMRPELRQQLDKEKIRVLEKKDQEEVKIQLFGKD